MGVRGKSTGTPVSPVTPAQNLVITKLSAGTQKDPGFKLDTWLAERSSLILKKKGLGGSFSSLDLKDPDFLFSYEKKRGVGVDYFQISLSYRMS